MRFSLLMIPLILVVASCSSHPFYAPEVSGAGVTWVGNGALFPLPAGHPEVQVKLVSRGFKDAPKGTRGFEGQKMLHLRMYIQTIKGTEDAASCKECYINPGELELAFADNTKIHPALIHASVKDKPVIRFHKRQVVDLYFPVDLKHPGKDISNFSLSWTIHYDPKNSEPMTTRFNRQDNSYQNDTEDMTLDQIELERDQQPPGIYDPWAWW